MYFHFDNDNISSSFKLAELSAGNILANFMKLFSILSNVFSKFQPAWSIHTYEYVKNLSVLISSFIASTFDPVIPFIKSVNLSILEKLSVCIFILS